MEVKLTAQTRANSGKGHARRARAQGQVPAVLYGSDLEATTLLVDAKAMSAALHTEAGANVLVNLELDSGTTHLSMPREVQRDPIRGDLIHVDFVKVARDVRLAFDVPLHVVGESPGVKEGGQLDQHLHDLKVEALPTEVPAAIEVDVSALGIGDSLRVADIDAGAEVTVLNDPEDLVVAVIEARIIEEPVPEPVEGEVAEVVEADAEAEKTEKTEQD